MAEVDVLVIGGAAAGLRAAVEAAGRGARVLVLNKGPIGRTGCSAFLDHRIEYSLLNLPDEPPDAPEHYRDDMLACGAGRNDRALVEAYVSGLFAERAFLASLGLGFRMEGGRPRRVHLPGHSFPRSLVTEAGFGRKLVERLAALARARGAALDEGKVVLDLLRAGGRVAGALAADARTGALTPVRAGAVVLAAGGLGRVFRLTTNPPDIGGDGVALAWRAGADLRDMEFVQCHPLVARPLRGTYLLSGILLAGRVRNREGEAFAFAPPPGLSPHGARKAHLRALCAWMACEARAARGLADGCMEWDGTAIPRETYETQMPATYAALRRAGADPRRDRLPIAPGAHQMLGGVRADADGRTPVPGLYVAGESLGGLHGADRLSGTGILEALVFGRRAGCAAAAFARAAGSPEGPLEAGGSAGGGGAPPASMAGIRALEARILQAMEPLLVEGSPADARAGLEALRGVLGEAGEAPWDPHRPGPWLRLQRVRTRALAASLVASAMAGGHAGRLEQHGG